MPIRLARFLVRAGVTVWRGAAELVRTGRVAVNGRAPGGPGDPIDPARNRVTLDGRPLRPAPPLWLALHKPPGYVTSRREAGRYPTVFALLRDASAGLVPVGPRGARARGCAGM